MVSDGHGRMDRIEYEWRPKKPKREKMNNKDVDNNPSCNLGHNMEFK